MKLYSPAIITAKERVVVGHGANIVWCDILARRARNRGERADYLYPSWNHQGKMFDGIGEDELGRKLSGLEKSMAKKLNLFGVDVYTEYRDSSPESRQNAQARFTKLEQEGYIKKAGEVYFLDVQKVVNGENFQRHLNGINFPPDNQTRRRLEDLARTLRGRYPISKPRDFATTIPSSPDSQEKINPIFDLAVSPLLLSPDSTDYAIECSRVLLHGVFVPVTIWAAISHKPFAKNILVHGLATGEGAIDAEEFFRQINAGPVSSDVMRYCAVQCTDSFEDLSLGKDRVSGAKKILYRTINLARHILKHHGPQTETAEENKEIDNALEKARVTEGIRMFEEEIFGISRRVNHSGKITLEDVTKYLQTVSSIKPIFPRTVERVEGILYEKGTAPQRRV